MAEAAMDLCARDSSSGLLFQALLPWILRDRGERPTGQKQQEVRVWEGLQEDKVFTTKGPRVAFRPWFSWMQSVTGHDS
eukprot:3453898-Lingulodinium_polyedra.AAC.1